MLHGLFHLQSDDNDPSEEEFSGSGLDPQVCVCSYIYIVSVDCNFSHMLNFVCLFCLQTDKHLSSRYESVLRPI